MSTTMQEGEFSIYRSSNKIYSLVAMVIQDWTSSQTAKVEWRRRSSEGWRKSSSETNEDYYSSQESKNVNHEVDKEEGSDEMINIKKSRLDQERHLRHLKDWFMMHTCHNYRWSWEVRVIKETTIVGIAVIDSDTMQYHQVLKEHDKGKYWAVIGKECEPHFKEGNYKLIKRSKPPEGATLFQVYGRRRERRNHPQERLVNGRPGEM